MLVLAPATALASSDDGLVAEWHFDEGSGSVLVDSSGNGNDGTIYGATWVDGKHGTALHFDGQDDYVTSSLNSAINEDLTIIFWMESNDLASYQQRLVDLGTLDSVGFQICMSPDGNLIVDNSGGPSSIVVTSNSYNDGIWHHIVGVREGSNYHLYVDGSYVDSTTGMTPSYEFVYIGKRASEHYFNGIIDEVRIYNRALAADEIKEHYEGEQTVIKPTEEVPVGIDSDGDGWSDEKEREMGTNPYSIDSDGDRIKDSEDPNPNVPEKKTPGFEIVFAITGLLVGGYLLRIRG